MVNVSSYQSHCVFLINCLATFNYLSTPYKLILSEVVQVSVSYLSTPSADHSTLYRIVKDATATPHLIVFAVSQEGKSQLCQLLFA